MAQQVGLLFKMSEELVQLGLDAFAHAAEQYRHQSVGV